MLVAIEHRKRPLFDRRDVIHFRFTVDGRGIDCRMTEEALLGRLKFRPTGPNIQSEMESLFADRSDDVQRLLESLLAEGPIPTDKCLFVRERSVEWV